MCGARAFRDLASAVNLDVASSGGVHLQRLARIAASSRDQNIPLTLFSIQLLSHPRSVAPYCNASDTQSP